MKMRPKLSGTSSLVLLGSTPPPRDLMSTEFYIVICDEVSVDFREIKPKRLIFRKPGRYTTIFSIRQFSAPQGNVVLITAK